VISRKTRAFADATDRDPVPALHHATLRGRHHPQSGCTPRVWWRIGRRLNIPAKCRIWPSGS